MDISHCRGVDENILAMNGIVADVHHDNHSLTMESGF
jgi:hypothetical protein